MKLAKLILRLFLVAFVFFVVVVLVVFFPIIRHDMWLNKRLDYLLDLPYAGWEEIYEDCRSLASMGKVGDFSESQGNFSTLPESLRLAEPRVVWVDKGNVTMRFSGGHARFVRVEYYGDRNPPELHLLAEWIFRGCVYPRDDHRVVRELKEDS